MNKSVDTPKKAKKLYENKFFYEIVKTEKGALTMLVGPLEDIRYVNKATDKYHKYLNYEFVSVENGQIVKAFTRNEILVTRRKI